MPNASPATVCAPVFAALGDETRLRIVSRLRDGQPRSIAALSTGEAVTRQAITKHLRVLEGAGLVRSSRHGRELHWDLERARLDDARAWIDDLSRQWDVAIEKLRAFVEED